MPDDKKIQVSPEQEAVAKICKRVLQQAKDRRERFETSGRDIMRYGYSKDYLFEYQNTNPNAWFKAKYAKTAEAFGVIVPRLMPSGNPNRMITLPEPNDALQARTDARQYYLNYTPQFTRWAYHRRKCTEEAVGYGRGVLWTGFDHRTGLVCSTWVPVEDIWDDPNAITCDDRCVIIRRRIVPRYEAIEEYPKAEQQIRDLPQAQKDTKSDRAQQVPHTEDSVCFYEFWFLNGVSGYKGADQVVREMAKAAGMQINDTQAKQASAQKGDTPIKYLVDENGKYIYDCPWPIGFHAMVRDPWPCTFLDLVDNPQSIYPVSMLEPGIGIQRAMNHLVTLSMGKMRHCMKLLFAVKKQNRSGLSKEDIRRALSGSDIEKIEIEFNGQTGTLKDHLETFNWDMSWVAAVQAFLQMLESIYERLTGMYSWLHSGQGQTQDRSAAATQARERNTMARIEDMRDTTREFDAIVASKECFAACQKLRPQDVQKILPARLAQAWGILVPPGANDPQALAQQAMQLGIQDPEMAQQYVSEMQAQTYTMDEIVYQSLFEIEAASTRRKDIDQQIDLMKEKLNTVVPVQLASPDFNERAIAYETLALDAKLEGLPNEQQLHYKQQAEMYRQLGQGQVQLQVIQLQMQIQQANMQAQMMAQGQMPMQPGQPGQPQQQPQPQGAPQ